MRPAQVKSWGCSSKSSVIHAVRGCAVRKSNKKVLPDRGQPASGDPDGSCRGRERYHRLSAAIRPKERGKSRAGIAAAEARRATAIAATTARARNAIANVEAAQRRVDALESTAVPEAAEALRLTERSYAEGRATLLELLDAQNAYTATRTALTDARLALALATAELGRIAAR